MSCPNTSSTKLSPGPKIGALCFLDADPAIGDNTATEIAGGGGAGGAWEARGG